MKPGFNSLRHATTGALAAFCAAAAIACSAQSTISQTSSPIGLTDTNWSSTLTVPQFNSSLGTLTSVVVTLNWTTFQSTNVANNDGANTDPTTGQPYPNGMAEDVYSDEGVTTMVTMPDGSTLNGSPPDLVLGSEVEIAGILWIPICGIDPNTSLTAGPTKTTGAAVSQTYTDAVTLGIFTGSGIVGFPAAANGSCTLNDSGGNVVWSATTQAGASITVTYTYTPPVVLKFSCIQGAVINNLSGDGRCGHSRETGLGSGIVINVYNTSGTLVGTAVTAKGGTFEVDGLMPNTTYTVAILTPSLPRGYSLSCKSDKLSVTTPATGCVICDAFTAVKCNTGCGNNTFCQSDWNNTGNSNSYNSCLRNYYCQVYPDGNCTIGGSNASCSFDSCKAIENCLVQSGYNCPLPQGCQTDPRSESNFGTLCGETLACKLNCDFSDAGIFCSGFKNLTCQSGKFKGCTVSQLLHAANCFLNGDKCLPEVPHCTANELSTCLQRINTCYRGTNGNNNRGTGFCK